MKVVIFAEPCISRKNTFRQENENELKGKNMKKGRAH
jgi:hypothetical protein